MKYLNLIGILSLYATQVNANPDGGVVTSGSATITSSGNTLEINQISPKALIDWNNFNINNGEATIFKQPDISSITINRIHSLDKSIINGRLEANGNIMLLNNNGILFGENADINIGGLIASGSSVKDDALLLDEIKIEEFTAPSVDTQTFKLFRTKMVKERDADDNEVEKEITEDWDETFDIQKDIVIENKGNITVRDGGSVIFAAPKVKNSGNITAKFGKVILGSSEKITMDLTQGGLVKMVVDPSILQRSIENTGTISAEGGLVELAIPELANRIQSQVIENTGNINASGGEVKINASDKGLFVNSGQISATGDAGGKVSLSARSIDNAGKVEARGNLTEGGSIEINVEKGFAGTKNSTITASGNDKGGDISITGSDSSSFYNSGNIKARGKGQDADGGKVVVETNNISMLSGNVDVSSSGNAGEVKLGDKEKTKENFIDQNTKIKADSKDNGEGGSIVVDSKENTKMLGSVSAKGKTKGGFVEISSKNNAYINGEVKVSSENGNNGELLIDPKNIVISTTGYNAKGLFYHEFEDPNPAAGNGFGTVVQPLSTGNVIITSPNDDAGATNAGAVYLFNGSDRSLISTLRAGIASTTLGGTNDIITLTGNGNFVVRKSSWNGALGAVTWVDGSVGLNGTMSTANSVYGTTANDQVGLSLTKLTNGNYVVRSSQWDDGATTNVGAVTWVNGSNGHIANTGLISGAVSTSNSLYGSTASDNIGSGLTALNNGNYVVNARFWNNGGIASAGSATWVDGSNGNIAGTTSPAGAVSTANSLYGAVTTNEIGFTVTALSHADGHYIVRSQNWEDSAVDDNRGAVTWVDGRNGHIAGSSSPGGAVTMANSLYGDADSLFLGSSVTTLTNGNYVVHTSNWNGNRGAAVWVDGNNGNIADTGSPGGVISAANSLSGGSVGDRVGSGVQALTNGHYVVRSSGWNSSAGAVTWVDGTNGHIAGSTAVSGNVSAANSIYNSGSGSLNQSVIPLTNGNYVVRMSGWSGFVGSGGSATWVDGNNGNIAGTSSPGGDISTTNSLYGSQAVDSVAGTGIQALSNGNYVVISSNWGNGGTSNVGAVTWVDGTNGHIAGTSSPGGAVSTSNSLYGGAASDAIGASGVVPLNNGNYFVLTPMWNNGATTGAGAVTWVNGSNGYIAGSSSPGGALSTSNSLYGSSANDQIGLKFGTGTTYLALSTGNYLVLSPDWDNGATAAAGAVTWVNGSDGNIVGTSSAGGAVTIYNSLVTNTASSGLLSAIEDTVNNTYVVGFPSDSGRGRVYVLPVSGELLNDGNDVTFAYVSSQDRTLHPDFITDSLDAGTNITLQANNDITINDPIITSGAGSGGDLTLQAGRSILINANITTDNGDFNAYANSTVADGVVNAQRDAGNAVITMAGGTTVDTGTGSANFTIKDGSGLTNNTSGDISLRTVNADHVNVINNGPSDGDIVLNNAINLTGTTMSNFATKGSFINNHGVGVLDSSDNWLIYLPNPTSITLNGLAYGSEVYSCNYFTGCTSSLTSGNALVYASADPNATPPAPTFDRRSYFYTISGTKSSSEETVSSKSNGNKLDMVKFINSSDLSNIKNFSVLNYLIFIVDSVAKYYNMDPQNSLQININKDADKLTGGKKI